MGAWRGSGLRVSLSVAWGMMSSLCVKFSCGGVRCTHLFGLCAVTVCAVKLFLVQRCKGSECFGASGRIRWKNRAFSSFYRKMPTFVRKITHLVLSDSKRWDDCRCTSASGTPFCSRETHSKLAAGNCHSVCRQMPFGLPAIAVRATGKCHSGYRQMPFGHFSCGLSGLSP